MTNQATRTTVLKTYLSDDEQTAFHRACTAIGITRAAKLREFCQNFARFNDRTRRRGKEGPSPILNRAQYFPGHRVSYGLVPQMRIRV